MKKFKVTRGNGEPVIMSEYDVYPLLENRTAAFVDMLKRLNIGEGIYSNDTMTNYERIE